MMLLSIRLLKTTEGAWWQTYTYHVIALSALVWVYPLYTLGFSSLLLGLAGNIGVGFVAAYVILFIRERSPLAAWLIVPTVVWLCAATFYVTLQLILVAQVPVAETWGWACCG